MGSEQKRVPAPSRACEFFLAWYREGEPPSVVQRVGTRTDRKWQMDNMPDLFTWDELADEMTHCLPLYRPGASMDAECVRTHETVVALLDEQCPKDLPTVFQATITIHEAQAGETK